MRGNAYKNLAHEYLHGSEDPSDMENFIFDLSNTEAKELEKEIKSKMFESKLTEGDDTQYSWGQINSALMKYGMSPAKILRFLSVLKKI